VLAPLAAQAAPLYVHAGKLVDTLQGKVLTDQLITIDGERIVSVAPWKTAPTDGKVIDWSTAWCCPA
jgi:imidazolonepropionase-like amidohydrolase